MAVDLSAFQGGQKTFIDQQQLQAEFELRKQLQAAQLLQTEATVQKLQKEAQFPDVDKLGEQALFKAAQGVQLSPQEEAAARYANAKTGGIQFDPVTGNMVQKPSIAANLGLNFAPQTGGIAQTGGPQLPALDPNNQFDKEFQQQFSAQTGNPKAQQVMLEGYAKSKYSPNEEQAKAAGYANRMVEDAPILTKPENVDAAANPFQRLRSQIPLVGNYLTSNEFKSGDQAQRDFVNALLRRESGAAISPAEFDNARKQYFPQPGEGPAIIAQKARNRETALGGVQYSAGPAYKKPQNAPSQQDALAELKRRGLLK